MTKPNEQTAPASEAKPKRQVRPRAALTPPAADPDLEPVAAAPTTRKTTRGETLIAMMRTNGGQSAGELAAAVGWQIHSVRGFIAGTVKKRTDLEVLTAKTDGVTRYQVVDRAEPKA